MKIVVIGGGIAGLCMGIYMNHYGLEVIVNERTGGIAGGGHAFLMHNEGICILQELQQGKDLLPGRLVDSFEFRRQDGQLLQEMPLKEWQCFKRTDLTAYLSGLMPAERLRHQRSFSHFIYEEGRVVAAEFLNGEREYGDIFVGADGANSRVRKELFGEVVFKTGRVKEIVGVVEYEELASAYAGKFSKFQYEKQGLAFGLIPTSATELVWFIQYDPETFGNAADQSPSALKTFCLDLLKGFPEVAKNVLMENDYTTSYIWNTKDFDLLPAFHQNNVVLIGDAAHLALPFTSAGTTNAMVDAKVLSHFLMEQDNYSSAFQCYYESRSEQVKGHVLKGRQLRDSFLGCGDPGFALPLIIDQAE